MTKRIKSIYSTALTMCMTTGGRARTIIATANHTLLFDSAYALRAEKAGDIFCPPYVA